MALRALGSRGFFSLAADVSSSPSVSSDVLVSHGVAVASFRLKRDNSQELFLFKKKNDDNDSTK